MIMLEIPYFPGQLQEVSVSQVSCPQRLLIEAEDQGTSSASKMTLSAVGRTPASTLGVILEVREGQWHQVPDITQDLNSCDSATISDGHCNVAGVIKDCSFVVSLEQREPRERTPPS